MMISDILLDQIIHKNKSITGNIKMLSRKVSTDFDAL